MIKTIIRSLCCFMVCMTAVGAFAQESPATVDTALLAALPVVEIDTSGVPDDELTREVKRLLEKTNSMSTGLAAMRQGIAMQRQARSGQVPEEFFDRFSTTIDNGRAGRLMEIVVIKIYRDKFTAKELKEINKFYDTPVGKKLAANYQNIATEAMAVGQKLGQYLGVQIIRDMISEGKWK